MKFSDSFINSQYCWQRVLNVHDLILDESDGDRTEKSDAWVEHEVTISPGSKSVVYHFLLRQSD